MKNVNKTIFLITNMLVFSLSVSAHDPSMHKKNGAQKADCSSYNKMVES